MPITSAELRERDQLPHFDVTTLDGHRIRYEALWQRRNAVLLLIHPQQREVGVRFTARLKARGKEFEEAEAALVVTSDSVPGLRAPRVVIADRWGEIMHVEALTSGDVSLWPTVDELLDWLGLGTIRGLSSRAHIRDRRKSLCQTGGRP